MKIEIPKINPNLITPSIQKIKSFVMSVSSAIFGYWNDTNETWNSSIISWGYGNIYSERPKIGRVKLKTPQLRHK